MLADLNFEFKMCGAPAVDYKVLLMVADVRTGKTTFGAYKAIEIAASNPNKRSAIICTDYRAMADYIRLVCLEHSVPEPRVVITQLTMFWANGHQTMLLPEDDYAMRAFGMNYCWIWIDDPASLKESIEVGYKYPYFRADRYTGVWMLVTTRPHDCVEWLAEWPCTKVCNCVKDNA